MKFKDIEFKKVKTYKVTKAVKLALLDGVKVSGTDIPEIPAANSVKSEEAFILGMTNLTLKDLEELTEKEYDKVLEKIESISTNPSTSSVK